MKRNEEKTQDLATRVQRLEDIEAIKQLKARYTRGGVPTSDLEVMMPLFTEDAVLDIEHFGFCEGTEAIRDFLIKASEKITWAIRYILSPLIEIADDGSTARGSWYLLGLANMLDERTGEWEAVWIAGDYDEEYVKKNGQWKFKRVTSKQKLVSPYADGWTKTPFRK